MNHTWTFMTAGQVTFGPGSIRHLGVIAERRRWRKIFIVTDPVLRDLGYLERVQAPLHEAGIVTGVFDEGEPEPGIDLALRLREQASSFQPDAWLGLGGGSNIDLAKLAAVLHSHPGSPADYFGFDRIPGPVQPIIGVPTTAGTGSEVSHAAVLTDREQRLKVSTLSHYLRPTVAVVDPEFTYACPRTVTADSGIDALTHAIEAYTAIDYRQLDFPPGKSCGYEGSFPLADLLAERAIALVGEHLVPVVCEPGNHESRDAMSLAATLAGMAFSNAGVALVHALEYPLGGELHCTHGAGNGLLLPHVMRFNLPTRVRQFARIAELLGEDTRGLTPEAAAERAIAAVDRIRAAIGIPARIRDLGGKSEQLPEFAEKAAQIRRLLTVNPRPAKRDDLLKILQAAF